MMDIFSLSAVDILNWSVHIGLTHFLLLAALLFSIGLYGLLTRRGISRRSCVWS